MRAELPADPVVLAVIARAAPERTVLAVDEDGVDRARAALLELEPVAHARELLALEGGCRAIDREAAGEGFVPAEGVAHLVARDVGGLRRLLHGHPELDHIEEEL